MIKKSNTPDYQMKLLFIVLSVIASLNHTFGQSKSSLERKCIEHIWYLDNDKDSLGDKNHSQISCVKPKNYVSNNKDENITTSVPVSNQEKAVSIIEAFNTGDPSVLDHISDENYIQHNLGGIKDGKEPMKAIFTGKPRGTSKVLRAFTDNNYVFMHDTHNNHIITIDVYRFENGKMVEHWDNDQIMLDPHIDPINGNTPYDGPREVEDLDKTDENKLVVTKMLNEIYIGGNWENANNYFREDYIEHTQQLNNGTKKLISKQGYPGIYTKPKLILGQGNFVLALSEQPSPTMSGTAIAHFDLYRLKNGKIVEHWDVQDHIPDASTWQHKNGKW